MRARGAAALACIAMVSLAQASPAEASPSTEVVEGAYLKLVSVADWERAADLGAGEKATWDVAISADAPEPGTIEIALSAEGGTPLVVDAALCRVEWRGEDCPEGAAPLRSAWNVPRDGEAVRIGEVGSDEAVHLRLAVGIASRGDGGATSLSVHAIGAGEDIAIGPGGELPPTGSSFRASGALAAAALLLAAGAAMLAGRSRRGASRGAS